MPAGAAVAGGLASTGAGVAVGESAADSAAAASTESSFAGMGDGAASMGGGSASEGSIAIPQFYKRLAASEETLARMEAFPKEVLAQLSADAPNSVAFGLNTLGWWSALIRRDIGEFDTDAIVFGGRILFGRWQEEPRQQSEVVTMLEKVAYGAQVEWVAPSARAWWMPLWERAMVEGFEPKLMAGLLQTMRADRAELADELFFEFANADVDTGVAVQELMEGEKIEWQGAFNLDVLQQLAGLRDRAMQGDLEGTNRELARLFEEIWEISHPTTFATSYWLLMEYVRSISGFLRQKAARAAAALGEGSVQGDAPLNIDAVRPRLVELLTRLEQQATNLHPHHEDRFYAYLLFAARIMGMTDKADAFVERLEDLGNRAQVTTVDQMMRQDQVISRLQEGHFDYVQPDVLSESRGMTLESALESIGKGSFIEVLNAISGFTAEEQAIVLAALAKALRPVQPVLNPDGLRAKLDQLMSNMAMHAAAFDGGSQFRIYPYLIFAAGILGPPAKEDEYRKGFQKLQQIARPFEPSWEQAIAKLTSGEFDYVQPAALNAGAEDVFTSALRSIDRGNIERAIDVAGLSAMPLEARVILLAAIAKAVKGTLDAQVQVHAGAGVSSPERVELERGKKLTIGREPRNDIAISHSLVSARHAEIYFTDDGRIVLMDTGSTNGTFAGGARVAPRQSVEIGARENFVIASTVVLNELDLPLSPDQTIVFEKLPDSERWVFKAVPKPEVARAPKPERVDLPPGRILTIGRGHHSDIIVDDEYVSASHANISYFSPIFAAPVLAVQDRGSSNGTYVDGVRLDAFESRAITPGSVFTVGTHYEVRNELKLPVPEGSGIAMEKDSETGQWVLRTVPLDDDGGAHAKRMDPNFVHAPFFDRLPRRDPSTIPEQYRHLIPNPQGIVQFPSFRRILNETASLIDAPERIAVRFFGPPGTAKTTIPEMIAQRMGVPLLRVPFSKRTDPSDLEGQWAMEEVEGEYVPVFKEGAPTIAMEHGFHLVLDEPDLARPGTLAFINNASAPGEFAWVRKKNGSLTRIRVHSDYRVYATENGAGEVSREEHGKDFLRRFVPYYVGPWSQEEVTEVLAERYENASNVKRWDRAVSQTLAYFHEQMRLLGEGFVDPESGQAMPPLGSGIGQQVQFTPRSVLRLAERLISQGEVTPESLSRAIRSEYILPLYDPADREIVWTQAEAIFGLLAEQMGWQKDDAGHAIGPHVIAVPTLEALTQKYFKAPPSKEILNGKFVWTDQALALADEILWNKSLGVDVMLLGEAGEGKTELPPQIAKLVGLPYYQKTVSSETDEEDLVGGFGRVNGRIAFIPDVVTLAAEKGAVLHLDEYMLADTGKLEAVMNPLMDSTQAVILKSPYRMVPRHEETFLILSSNPPFGEYADRNEQSGAAMSRVAVICLSGQLSMRPRDRQLILRRWIERQPPGRRPGPVVKKKGATREAVVPHSATTGDDAKPIIREAVTPSRLAVHQAGSGQALTLPVHEQIREKFGLPKELFLDTETGDLLEVMDGAKVPLGEAARKALKVYADYLTRRTQIEMTPVTKKVVQILYAAGGNHHADLSNKRIVLNLAHLLGLSLDAALGAGKHEWAHVVIDRGSATYDAHEPGRLYANVVGDPRMNEYAGSLRADFARQIDALYNVLWHEHSTQEQQASFQRMLPHEQFADAIIYFWRFGQVMPAISDERVLEALAQALPILEPAFTLFPASTDKEDVDAAAEAFYLILDQAYPFYQALLPEGLEQLLQALAQGADPDDLMQVPFARQRPPSGSKPSGGDAGNGAGGGVAPAAEEGSRGKTIIGFPAAGDDKGEHRAAPVPLRGDASHPESPSESGRTDPGGLAKKAQEILDKRAEQLADRFEPQDPEAFEARKQRVAQAKGQAVIRAENNAPDEASDDAPQPMVPAQLTPEQMRKIDDARKNALARSVEGDLYRTMVPARAIQAARKLKRVMPPGDPTYLDGFYTTGKRLDRKRSIQDGLRPVPSGKVMLRRMRPDEYDANVVELVDVSSSMRKAQDNVLRGSAASTFLGDHLGINYGKIAFAGTMKVVKPLGKPVKTYAKKNALLHDVKKVFSDKSIVDGTNIREPLAAAIEMIRRKKARSNFIVLITDGAEGPSRYPKTLAQLEAEAEKEGITILVLAMGNAQRFVPKHFKHYRFVAPDGADIPDKMVELYEEAHRKRLP
jgi:MoxR-like ATPase/pSer/pThr/pTyr-binding forkhead associated (FHA) protein